MTTGKFHQGNIKNAKLTPSQVQELLNEYFNQNATQGFLARKYRVSIGTIGRIVRGESWQAYSRPSSELETQHHEVLGDIAAQSSETPEAVEAARALEEFIRSTAEPIREDVAAMFLANRGPQVEIDRRRDLVEQSPQQPTEQEKPK